MPRARRCSAPRPPRSRPPPGRRSTRHDAALALLLAAGALVVAGVGWLEAGPTRREELALIATLGGVAAAGRVLFAPSRASSR